MNLLASYCMTIIIVINILWNAVNGAETTISVTAPVNPVDQGAIFALHCQVWNLKEGQEVTLIRNQDGHKKRIFLNEVLHLQEDRVFLALRQMGDGSTVYFVSIMGVSRADEGEYMCKITDTEGAVDLPFDAVHLQTLFFPSDNNPKCSSDESRVQIYVGTLITMNCTSHTGNPSVDITWHDSQTRKILPASQQYTDGDSKVSVLNYKATLRDKSILLVCQITSVSFPGRVQSCHIGPYTVIPNADGSISPTSNPRQTDNHNIVQTDSVSVSATNATKYNCERQCSILKSPVAFWVIATVVAICMAIIFFILVLTLYVKYRRVPPSCTYSAPHGQPTGKIYDEIQRRHIDDRVYMSLVKLKRQHEESTIPARINVGRYDSP